MTAPASPDPTPDPSADRPSGARGRGELPGADGEAEGLEPDERAAAEAQALIERYTRRGAELAARYRLLDPAALAEQQGRLRAWTRLWAAQGWSDLSMLHMLEVGCGDGGNLLDLLRLGARPEHLRGLELQPERATAARARLPAALRIELGDALAAEVAPASQDAVLQFTVFSSILDDAVQQRLAQVMWSWVKPGGGVLWYDFAVGNPRNRDVRGVPLARVRALFPEASAQVRRLTLAPPIARRVGRWWPGGITWLHALLPPLRTHRLVWLRKPR